MSPSTDTALSPQPSAAYPPRLSATLVVVRDGPGGLEVLLSRRAERGDYSSGAWVFPGGVVDPGDRLSHGVCAGLNDAAASARLGVAANGLDFYIAAVRECFEESGLLYAEEANDTPNDTPPNPQRTLIRLDPESVDPRHRALDTWRDPLHRNVRSLGELCREFDLTLALDRIIYLGHWVTPLLQPKRFDTRFFLAAAPLGQTAAFDGAEMLEQAWLRPDDALAQAAALKLMTPTRATLAQISGHKTVEALLAWARAPREIVCVMPHIAQSRGGPRPVLPGEPAYAELGRIDPAGLGNACCEIQVDTPVRLSSRVIRITAGNGSLMTGPGTNTYLIGGGASNTWAVIDPGPNDPVHIEAILAAAPGPIRWIFATHTHSDHSPACAPLKLRTGAVVHGRLPAHREWQDASFDPDVHLSGGETFVLPGPDGEASTLRVIHTPGHASNHLCYLLDEERLVFTGDHVMQLSTVVINPPDGDMAAYLGSLRSLVTLDLDWLAPGHGFLMANPRQAMEAIVAHRLRREAKVVDALAAIGPASEDALLARVYDDVKPQLLAMAMRSLRAHLYKLGDEGAAVEHAGRWALGTPGAKD